MIFPKSLTAFVQDVKKTEVAVVDRKAGVLWVHAIHQDIPLTKSMTTAMAQEIEDLAHWLDLGLTLPH